MQAAAACAGAARRGKARQGAGTSSTPLIIESSTQGPNAAVTDLTPGRSLLPEQEKK